MFFFRHIFITGRVARIDNVFIDNSLFHKLFERPVDGRLSDRVFAGTEMLAQFSCGDMRTAQRLEIIKQFFPLFCFVSGSVHKCLSI